MNIKVKEAVGEVLPEADGYLVQAQFKNGFKDFKIGQCFYASTVQSIKDALHERNGSRVQHLRNLEGLSKKAAQELETKVNAALQGTDFQCKLEDYYGDPALRFFGAYQAKVWALADGADLPVAQSVYLLSDGTLAVGRKGLAAADAEMEEALKSVGSLLGRWYW